MSTSAITIFFASFLNPSSAALAMATTFVTDLKEQKKNILKRKVYKNATKHHTQLKKK